MNSNMSDTEKVSLLYTLYEQEMYRICFAILNERYAAEDAVSESFLKLIKARHKIANPRDDSCGRYVIKITKNTAIDMYRKNTRDREFCGEYSSLAENEVGKLGLDAETDLFAVADAMDKLSKKLRDVVECVCISGLSVRETSAVLNISEACVRKRLERVRQYFERLGVCSGE